MADRPRPRHSQRARQDRRVKWLPPTSNLKHKDPVQVTIKDGNLIVAVPLQTPTPSKSSGKTLVVASTHGNVKTTVEVNGKPVTIGLNAFIAAK
jgi:hypothetical protein